MFDFTPPADPKLAAMVSHARQLLLRAPTPESLALYFGVESVDSLDVLEIERSLPDGHHIDYQDAEHLNELVSWLESYVREEPAFESLIGHDPVFLHVLALAREQAERTSTLRDLCPVRIMGPTGSGKELLGRAIHRASGLPEESFVAVHCAGITDELLESTLFGYEGRAFTGASSKGKDGLVSKAEGGTLFLDEVGDLPPRAQVTLLRFLQDQRYRRVGGIDELQANVRVMCATWKDLEALAKKELFRRDLLYRLSGARLELPSLLARRDELLDVAEAMLVRAGVAEQPPVDPQARLVIGHTPPCQHG